MVKRPSTRALLNKINLRTFIHSKFQFLAVIFITAIAICLYVGLTSNAKSIKDRVDSLYNNSNIADIWITVSVNDSQDYDNLSAIVKNKGEIEERYSISADINSYTSNALISKNIPTINKPFETDNKAEEDFFLVDYRLLETQTNESSTILWKDDNGNYIDIPLVFSWANCRNILKNTIAYEGLQYSVLDVLDALTIPGKENVFNQANIEVKLKPTGVMHFGENVQSSLINSSNFLLGQSLFLKTLDNLINENFAIPSSISSDDPLYDLKNYLILAHDFLGMDIIEEIKQGIHDIFLPNQYVIKLYDSSLRDEVIKDIEQYYENKENNNLLLASSLNNQSFDMIVQNDIIQAQQLAYIFPVIFFLVAVLVVLTTVSQIIIKDRITIGTMKALGLTNNQIMVHYMSLASFIILIGIIIGVILGPIILPFIMNQKYAILYSLPAMTYTISIPEALISALLVILSTIIVTYFVIRKSIKLNPAESMRNVIVKSMKAPKKERLKSAKFIPLKMALRNIRLNIAKSLMVIIGICGCSALLVCGFGIDDTLDNGINHDVENFFKADGYVFYSSTISPKDQLLSIEGIEIVEEYANLPTDITFNDMSYDSYIYVFSDNSNFFPMEEYNIYDKIAVSNKVANQLNLKVGDVISFSSFGLNFTGEIGAIIEVFYMHGIYINSAYNNYSELFEYKTNAWLDVNENYQIEDILNEIINIDGVSSCRSKQESIDIINNYMSSIKLMTLAVKVFAILLAVVVLYNLCLLNYKERARDIATLKVLGFSRLEISSSLLIESLTLTIIGVTLGMFLGMPMEILVLVVNMTPLVEFLYAVYPMSYVFSILISLGTAIIVNLFLTQKIKGIKMVESLKSIE